MPLTGPYEIVCDTSQFTPLQLQPRSVMLWSMNCFARWVLDRAGGWIRMLHEHRTGIVVGGARVDYLEPFRFFDASRVEAYVRLWCEPKGAPVHAEYEFTAAGRPVARVRHTLIPVQLSGDESLAATPVRLSGELLERFLAEVDERERPRRARLAPAVEAREQGAPVVAERRATYRLHRHQCEVADQWLFTELPALAAAGREELAFSEGQSRPELRKALKLPLRTVDCEYLRPFFLFEEVTQVTRAYHGDDGIFYVHRLLGRDGVVHGLVLEEL